MNLQTKWVRIAPCDVIPLREGHSVQIKELEIAIFNLGDRFLAIDNRCPHSDGPHYEGIVSEMAGVQPLHGRKIDLETGNVGKSSESTTCLKTFRVRVEEGIILLEVPGAAVTSKGKAA